MGFYNLPTCLDLQPVPIKTLTPAAGNGFSWVRVQVGKKYLGVTRGINYVQTSISSPRDRKW
jgi:hypothetical protein